MKKTVYFDFDGTLYDSDNLVKNFLDICQKYNITFKQEQGAENTLFTQNDLFNLDKIASYLFKKYALTESFLTEVEKLYSSSNLYPDVLSSLKKLKQSEKYNIAILTYGNSDYQKKKIINSNISEYINDIIITEDKKTNIANIDYKNSIFIDNNPEQIENLIKVNCHKVIRIRRLNDKYSKIDTKTFVNEYDNLITLVEEELL